MRVLILGGTAEANALARALVGARGLDATISLAGRTQNPILPPIPYRIGGFGGAAGLATYLTENGVDRLIDATHPFAAQISRNAALAAAATNTRLLAIRRPAWEPGAADRWIPAPDLPSAAALLGHEPRRVFLAVGRQELAPFRAGPHFYVIRSVEAPQPADLPPRATIITARGPFARAAEIALLQEHRIDILVTKNSGGVTGEKLAAARALGLPVMMVARPEKPPVPAVADMSAALAWLHHPNSHDTDPDDTDRGV